MNGTAMNETFMNDEPVSSPTVSPSRAALSAGAMFFINGAVFSRSVIGLGWTTPVWVLRLRAVGLEG
jgi:hypothetical protein